MSYVIDGEQEDVRRLCGQPEITLRILKIRFPPALLLVPGSGYF